MAKSVETVVNETIEARRLTLTTELKKNLENLFLLAVDTNDKTEKDCLEFAANMCLSEAFRSVGYWENHLFQTIKSIQITRNETQEVQ